MAYRSLLILMMVTQPVLLLQTGCDHYKPYDVHSGRLRKGPGLFSGPKGYFEVKGDIPLKAALDDSKSAPQNKRPPEEDVNLRRHLDTSAAEK